MNIRIDIKIEHWPIARLIPRITNPRTHTPEQVAQVAASMIAGMADAFELPIAPHTAGGPLLFYATS